MDQSGVRWARGSAGQTGSGRRCGYTGSGSRPTPALIGTRPDSADSSRSAGSGHQSSTATTPGPAAASPGTGPRPRDNCGTSTASGCSCCNAARRRRPQQTTRSVWSHVTRPDSCPARSTPCEASQIRHPGFPLPFGASRSRPSWASATTTAATSSQRALRRSPRLDTDGVGNQRESDLVSRERIGLESCRIHWQLRWNDLLRLSSRDSKREHGMSIRAGIPRRMPLAAGLSGELQKARSLA